MALRIRVELVPHGREEFAEVLDEVVVGNNGTGIRGGPNSGGVGNYDVYDIPLSKIHSMDYPETAKLGEIRGLERSPDHRLTLAELALAVVNESRKKIDPDDKIVSTPEARLPCDEQEILRKEEQDARR